MLNSRFVRALALTTAIAAFGAASHEALATSQTGHASATILQAITVTENTQMNFASISAPAAGGNVVLAPAGTIGPVAGFVFVGTPAAGVFGATGSANSPAVISFSSGDTLTGPGAAMALGTFTTNPASPTVFDGSGNLTINVGATLTVGANQVAGAYSGTYTITVVY
jgi:Mat/Ecp fimbriae major subunit